MGLDISCFGANSVTDVLNRCESDSRCVGFITATSPQGINQISLGCTKYAINASSTNGINGKYTPNATYKTVDAYVKK